MQFLRYILFPFALLYGGIVWLRNKFFDWRIIASETFKVPVICVGNLNVGGTGKSPMTEYLLRFLKQDYTIAVLSRGYGRHTKGFRLVKKEDDAIEVGDEPLQFKRKFPDVSIAVDEKRAHGIKELLKLKQPPEIVLLDDAYQHRYVTAHVNILLTAYDDLYVDDVMLPTGNLREPKTGAARADVIVVTKCPPLFTEDKRQAVTKRLKPLKHQQVCFSYISYADKIYNAMSERYLKALNANEFTLVTGIANPEPLVTYLKSCDLQFEHLKFSDHHNFSEKDIRKLKTAELILATEKDYVRLKDRFSADQLFYIPIRTQFFDTPKFEELLKQLLLQVGHSR